MKVSFLVRAILENKRRVQIVGAEDLMKRGTSNWGTSEVPLPTSKPNRFGFEVNKFIFFVNEFGSEGSEFGFFASWFSSETNQLLFFAN